MSKIYILLYFFIVNSQKTYYFREAGAALLRLPSPQARKEGNPPISCFREAGAAMLRLSSPQARKENNV